MGNGLLVDTIESGQRFLIEDARMANSKKDINTDYSSAP